MVTGTIVAGAGALITGFVLNTAGVLRKDLPLWAVLGIAGFYGGMTFATLLRICMEAGLP